MLKIGDYCYITSYKNPQGIWDTGHIIKKTGDKFMIKIGYYKPTGEWTYKFKAFREEDLDKTEPPGPVVYDECEE